MMEIKAAVVETLYHWPPLPVSGIVTLFDGSSVGQVQGVVNRPRAMKIPYIEAVGTIDGTNGGRPAIRYGLTDRGRRWHAWSVAEGMVES